MTKMYWCLKINSLMFTFNEIEMLTNITCCCQQEIGWLLSRPVILISVTEICDFQIFFWGTDTCLPSQLNLVTFVPGLFWISCQWLFYSVVLVLTTDSKEACRKIQLTWKIRLILQNKRRIFESMKVSLPSFLSLLLLFWEVRWHAGYGKHVSIDGNFSRGAF